MAVHTTKEQFLQRIQDDRAVHDLTDDDCERLAELTQLPRKHWEKHYEVELARIIEMKDREPVGHLTLEQIQRIKERRKAQKSQHRET